MKLKKLSLSSNITLVTSEAQPSGQEEGCEQEWGRSVGRSGAGVWASTYI